MADTTITVNLLDKDYQIACPPEQQEALRRSARSLDQRLREIRNSSNVVGLERIAIMAALNLSFELQSAQEQGAAQELDEQLLREMFDKLDRALAQPNG